MFEHRTQPGWVAVEDFLATTVVHPDDALKQAVRSAVDAGMPPIEVTPNAGKLLKLLVQLSGARRVLEIGTLAGFSTIWMAQGLPDDGRLVTCEFLTKHADIAKANVEAAGLGDKVEVRVGAALDTLAALQAEGQEPFGSSMRTRKTTPPTLNGPSAWAGREPPWCWTMPCGRARCWILPWTRSTRPGSSAHWNCWATIRSSTPQ